jgi:microcystin-dependent protein
MSYNTVDQSTGALKQAAGSTLTAIYADAPVGAIVPYGGDTAPTGYLLCDGSAVSRTTYADLFAVIGTKYGSGDGSTTFNLPDGEAGAELYPAADVGSGIAGSVYIIKAVKTALPTDFKTALDEKQDIVDNALQTTSKEIVGAINEINSDLTVKGQLVELYTGPGGNFTTPIPDDSKYLIVRIATPNGGSAMKFYPTELIRVITIHETAYWNTVAYAGYDVLAIYDITETSIIPIVSSHGPNTGDISLVVMSIN